VIGGEVVEAAIPFADRAPWHQRVGDSTLPTPGRAADPPVHETVSPHRHLVFADPGCAVTVVAQLQEPLRPCAAVEEPILDPAVALVVGSTTAPVGPILRLILEPQVDFDDRERSSAR